MKKIQQNAKGRHSPTLVLTAVRHAAGQHTRTLRPQVSHLCHATVISRIGASSKEWAGDQCRPALLRVPERMHSEEEGGFFSQVTSSGRQREGHRLGYVTVMRITDQGHRRAVEPVIHEGNGWPVGRGAL